MIIQCPQCLKRYRLPQEQTRGKKIKVKCRICGYTFHVDLEDKPQTSIQGDKPTHLIIADIQREFRERVVKLLHKEGYTIIIIEDGSKVLHLIEKENPALVLINPYLPHMMGFKLIEEIRHAINSNIPIVLLGAIHNPKRYHRMPSTLYGANAYVEEGMADHEVIKTIKNLIKETK